MQSTLRKIFAKRFRTTRKTPKYGSLNKAPTELELEHFLRNVPNYKFGLLFKYQAFLGLRIGEVCKLHMHNINFEKRELTIKTEKANKIDSLLIPLDLFKETVEYITKNEASIKASNGYIFFKDNDNNNNGLLHIDTNYARRVFRDVCKKCDLDVIYDYSEELYQNHRPRPLHRLTTHSLRHYAITRFAKSTNGNVVLASRFARHSNVTTTMRYIAKDNEELYRNIDYAFSTDQIQRIKKLANHSN